ncbi:hypothetical protein HMPREF9530_00774, partial [Escherichia coli MS 21-1]
VPRRPGQPTWMWAEGASYKDNEMDAPDFTVSKYQTGSLQYVLKN